MSRRSTSNDRDEPADHSEDPRKAGVGSGGYPEESPAGDADGRPDDAVGEHGAHGGRRRADGDPGQGTGNPGAAGAEPERS